MTVCLHDAREIIEKLEPRLERKFYLPPGRVELACGMLRTLCRPDGDYPVEEIHSLYFDTTGLDELERSLAGEFLKNKVRIRWYSVNGRSDGLTTAFLELKSRRGFASTKQRFKIEVPSVKLESSRLAAGIVPRGMLTSVLAAFGFFPVKPLLPVITISYLRFRFHDALASTSLALDCHIRSTPARPDVGSGERELELSGAVLEIKGHDMELPFFLTKLRLLDIDWSQYSKYSACLEAHRERCGSIGRLSPPGRNVAALPVMLHAPGHAAGLSGARDEWSQLFSLSCDTGFLPASADDGAAKQNI